MAPVKEPHFFSDTGALSRSWEAVFNIVKVEDVYLRLFAGRGAARFAGEGSTSYLSDRDAPDRIHAVRPDAAIIALLRDPIERAYSHYLNDVREGIERRSFVDAIEIELSSTERTSWPSLYVGQSRYLDGIRRYHELFDRVLVLYFEELSVDPAAAVRTVFSFLGLEAPDAVLGHENHHAQPRAEWIRRMLGQPEVRLAARRVTPFGMRRRIRHGIMRRRERPPLPEEARRLLVPVFAQELPELEQLLGRPMPWRDSLAG